jgi:outer membrane protein OmpA-like peptidoglycan-associated protein/tetratricopeptide (TPR) repeat protein
MKSTMKRILLFIVCLIGLNANSQSKKVWIYNADNFYAQEDYFNALTYYKKALNDSVGMGTMVFPYEIEVTNQKLPKKGIAIDSTQQVSLEDYVDHQIAMCYQKTYDYNHAADYFAKTSKKGSYSNDQFYYANALMNVKKYDQAISEFETYIKSEKYSDSLLRTAQLNITGCYYALNSDNIREEVQILLADTSVFNKGTSAFAVNYFGSENRVMFTSARPGGVILEPEQESAFLCDIYWTERDENGNWGKATNFGRPLNSAQHDAASAINNQNVIFYTRWSDDNRKDQSIYLGRMVDFKFYEAYKLDAKVNVPGYKSMQPFVSMDGQTLYFSSNRPGGQGGFDIWKIAIDPLGNLVGDAINLGYPVNSDLDEVTPFFHEASSTLFFSSNGHNSIGGLDVYKSYYDKDGETFNTPANLGLPINSSKDDAYLIWDTKLMKGFLSSDREPCENGHCFDIYEVTNEPIRIVLSGYTYDAATNDILPNTSLTFKDVDGEFAPFVIQTDSSGFYEKELTQGWELFIKAQKEKYFADAANINTKTITESVALTQDFYLNPIPKEEIEIEGIEYDFDSDKLRPISMQRLDKIYEFLVLNNNLVVEINSHTDSRGVDIYNLDLSQRRAKSCVDYLVSKGIARERLIPKGYGETQPNFMAGSDKKPVLNENGDRILLTEDYINKQKTKERKEELHQRNRRTSFKVVGENYEVISN